MFGFLLWLQDVANFFRKIGFWWITTWKDTTSYTLGWGLMRSDWEKVPWTHLPFQEDLTEFFGTVMTQHTTPEEVACVISSEAYGYGRTEAVIKFPTTPGAWSAFWTLDQDLPGKEDQITPEYDFEHCGGKRWVTATMHVNYGSEQFRWTHSKINKVWAGRKFNACKQLHTYTIDWSPFRVKWLIDGITVKVCYLGVSTSLRQTLFGVGHDSEHSRHCHKKLTRASDTMNVYSYKHHPYEVK